MKMYVITYGYVLWLPDAVFVLLIDFHHIAIEFSVLTLNFENKKWTTTHHPVRTEHNTPKISCQSMQRCTRNHRKEGGRLYKSDLELQLADSSSPNILSTRPTRLTDFLSRTAPLSRTIDPDVRVEESGTSFPISEIPRRRCKEGSDVQAIIGDRVFTISWD